MRFKDLTDLVVGRLTVLEVSHKNASGVYYWKCQCSCGNSVIVARNALQQQTTKSCGCLLIESRQQSPQTHGMSKTPAYIAWREMLNRCTLPSKVNYKYYGGNGITVCEEWKKFETFYADMGDKPEGTWLERIDGSLGYFKSNCKWETVSRQCSNRTRSNNTSGRIGVCWDKNSSKWRVEIVVDKKRLNFGRYMDFDEACAVVEAAELEHLGYSRKEFTN